MEFGVETQTEFQERQFTTVGGITNAVVMANVHAIINALVITNVPVNTNVVATINVAATISAFGMVKTVHLTLAQGRLVTKSTNQIINN